MGMSRSPVVICGNVNSRRVIHAPSAIAGPLHERNKQFRDAERRFPVKIRIGIPPKESATGSV